MDFTTVYDNSEDIRLDSNNTNSRQPSVIVVNQS